MARVEISEAVQNTAGQAISGASVQVNVRGGAAATLYAAETGATTVGNPRTTDTAGRIEAWVPEGSYDLVVSRSGYTSYTQPYEASSGATGAGVAVTLEGPLNVKSYGALGDGTTNDTTAIQNAMNAASAAATARSDFPIGDVFFPPGIYRAAGLSNPGRCRLRGDGAMIKANASGTLLTMAGVLSQVEDLAFHGNGVGQGANGIVWGATYWGRAHNLRLEQFSGRAILTAGIAHDIRSILAYGCLLTAPAAKTGVVELTGTDTYVENVEASGSLVALSSANAYKCAIAVSGGGTHFIAKCMAEIADIGMYINGPVAVHITDVRADQNFAHGFEIVGGSGMIVNSNAYRNGLQTNNTYSGFKVTAGNFDFSNCQAESIGGENAHKYGFEDTQASQAIKNRYNLCRSFGHVTKAFSTANDGASVTLPDHPAVTRTGTTPSVDQITQVALGNGSATTITDFTSGVNGQPLTLFGDGQSTIQHNGVTILLKGGANLLLGLGKVMTLRYLNGMWWEV